MKKKTFLKIFLVLVLIGLIVFILNNNSTVTSPSPSANKETKTAEFDKTKHSTKISSSLWVIVNKQQSLPADFVPKDLLDLRQKLVIANVNESQLRSDAAKSLYQMINQADKENVPIQVISGYRSYGLQSVIYSSNVAKEGQAGADKTSARPGHSEHQTGLALDINNFESNCRIQICFADTKTGKWVAKNAHKYGYIIRYQKGTQDVVGFSFEPWHLRYVGKELATELYEQKTTMEEFFGYPPAPNYK